MLVVIECLGNSPIGHAMLTDDWDKAREMAVQCAMENCLEYGEDKERIAKDIEDIRETIINCDEYFGEQNGGDSEYSVHIMETTDIP